jgi:hypothetical protein
VDFPSAELQASQWTLGAIVSNDFLNDFPLAYLNSVPSIYTGKHGSKLCAAILIAIPWFVISGAGLPCRAQGGETAFATLSRTCKLYGSSIDRDCIRANQADFERLYFQGSIPAADKVEIARQLIYSYGSSPSDGAAMREVIQKIDEYKYAAESADAASSVPSEAAAEPSTSAVPATTIVQNIDEYKDAAASADAASSVPSDAAAEPSTSAVPATTIVLNISTPSSRFIRGIPQCTRTQYQSQGASLWLLNSCNVPVTVEFTSDSGHTWGQAAVVNAGSRVELTTFGIGYDPRKDGNVYLFTCPNGSQPVMPNGNAFLPRNYKGEFTCALQ